EQVRFGLLDEGRIVGPSVSLDIRDRCRPPQFQQRCLFSSSSRGPISKGVPCHQIEMGQPPVIECDVSLARGDCFVISAHGHERAAWLQYYPTCFFLVCRVKCQCAVGKRKCFRGSSQEDHDVCPLGQEARI